jgi:hypothetical protein
MNGGQLAAEARHLRSGLKECSHTFRLSTLLMRAHRVKFHRAIRGASADRSERVAGPTAARSRARDTKQTPVAEFIRDRRPPFARRQGYSTFSGILATLINGRASWLRS